MKPNRYDALVVLSWFAVTIASIHAMRIGEWGLLTMVLVGGVGLAFMIAAFRWKADRG